MSGDVLDMSEAWSRRIDNIMAQIGCPANRDVLQRVAIHVERHLGAVEGAFCGLEAASPHIDVLWVRPTRRDPNQHLVTAGMSAKRMKVPRRRSVPSRIELVLTIPGSWPIDPKAYEKDEGWPLRELVQVACTPHTTGRWMGLGHVISPVPVAALHPATELCGWVLTPPTHVAEGFQSLGEGSRRVAFFSLVAIHRRELEFSIQQRPEALVDRLSAAGVSPVLDLERPSTFPGRWIPAARKRKS
jgi:hypothetical protein